MPRLFAFLAVALAACDSGSAVTQPIAFNHKAHIDSGLECTFCHESVENEETAGVPTTETCVACHEDTASLAATGHDVALADGTEKEKLHAYLARGGPVPWRRIYDLPDHVYFSHRRHVSVAGIECGECHGDVSNLSVPASRPLVDHDMDWCTGCHEARGASNDCIHCHT